MDSTGEDVLDDILLEHVKGDSGIHTIQKTVSFFFFRWNCPFLFFPSNLSFAAR